MYAKIKTFGEFRIEKRFPSSLTSIPDAQYHPVPWEDLTGHSIALTLLKILLCRAQRRATKQELITILWPHKEPHTMSHTLDVGASLLRRRILRTHTGESLLQTNRINGETFFKLPDQTQLWVDADAFLLIVSQVDHVDDAEKQDLLEQAYSLAHGEFLEDDLQAGWTQARRQTIHSARHRVLYQLVAIYKQQQRLYRAEELLFAYLEQYPTDEDILCQLLTLLEEQGRRHQARSMYLYATQAMREIGRKPSPYTHTLIKRMNVLHEKDHFYSRSTVQQGGVVCTWKFIHFALMLINSLLNWIPGQRLANINSLSTTVKNKPFRRFHSPISKYRYCCQL